MKIASIRKLPAEMTVDLEVPQTHSYQLGNGAVSHNTSSKVLGHVGDEVHEGAHVALSRFIFNNIVYAKNDPFLATLIAANYRVVDHPTDPTGVLVTLPIEYPDSGHFTKVEKNGEVYELPLESAIDQLERYRMVMTHYVDNNCSITVSMDEDEIEDVADWFMEHWDSYVGVSFLKRNDPTKSAAELGFLYLPQECVGEARYRAYADTLLPVDLSNDRGTDVVDAGGCGSGACPVR